MFFHKGFLIPREGSITLFRFKFGCFFVGSEIRSNFFTQMLTLSISKKCIQWTLVIRNVVFNNFPDISNNFHITVSSFSSKKALIENIGLANIIFCKFLVISKRKANVFLKFNNMYSENVPFFTLKVVYFEWSNQWSLLNSGVVIWNWNSEHLFWLAFSVVVIWQL